MHSSTWHRTWHRDWIFVTSEDALPSPGDQLPVKVGDQPAVHLHSQTGHLAALSNLCAHRGTLLVEKPANAKRVQCPYHGWTYGYAGRLLGAPFAPKGTHSPAVGCTAHGIPRKV